MCVFETHSVVGIPRIMWMALVPPSVSELWTTPTKSWREFKDSAGFGIFRLYCMYVTCMQLTILIHYFWNHIVYSLMKYLSVFRLSFDTFNKMLSEIIQNKIWSDLSILSYHYRFSTEHRLKFLVRKHFFLYT